MVKIAVLVSGGGTNLQALIDAEQRGEIIGGKIAAGDRFQARCVCADSGGKRGHSQLCLARRDYDSARV